MVEHLPSIHNVIDSSPTSAALLKFSMEREMIRLFILPPFNILLMALRFHVLLVFNLELDVIGRSMLS